MKAICLVLVILISVMGIVPAGSETLRLPDSQQMLGVSEDYSLPVLKGLRINPQEPLSIEFIIDLGDSKQVNKDEIRKLALYFLAGLTIPEDSLWVNLSPYEKNRIIPQKLGQTNLGQDLLGQDYILKQLASSFTHPGQGIGRSYWEDIYKEVSERIGTTNLPISTFNRIWVKPGESFLYEKGNVVLILDAKLEAMLEQDYLALKSNLKEKSGTGQGIPGQVNAIASKVMRERVLPEIKNEVNRGKNFASLRQMYYSLILANWFKKKSKESFYKNYIDQEKILGIDAKDKDLKDKIYDQYVKAFKKGVYDFIKEEIDPSSRKQIRRRYHSGGFSMGGIDHDQSKTSSSRVAKAYIDDATNLIFAKVDLGNVTSSPVKVLSRVNTDKLVADLLEEYESKSGGEINRLDKLESIVRPAAIAIEQYLYEQYSAEKIAEQVYRKGMDNIIPNLAKWYTDPYMQESTILGIEDAVSKGYWEFIAQAYMSNIPYGTAGVRGRFAFDEYFHSVARAAAVGRGLQVPNLKGPNTFNDEVLRQFTLGVLRYLENQNPGDEISDLKLFAGFDSRVAGQELADLIKNIGLAYGVTVYISDEAMPLPEFSNSLEKLSGGKGAIGIYVSASHNVKRDNGVKLIGPDGMQLGADNALRTAVMEEFSRATVKEVAELLEKAPSGISKKQVVFMGGSAEERLPGVDYGEHEVIDTHTSHFEAVLRKVGDRQVIKEQAGGIKILYSAFHGAGRKAAPRVLSALGFQVETLEAMDPLDGTLPEFADNEAPDPALVRTWEIAMEAYLKDNDRKDLLAKDLFAANDPDADRFGGVIRISPEEIPDDSEVAEAMGIVLVLNKDEQVEYGYGGFRVMPPNEWNALITFYDLSRLKDSGELDTNKHVIVFSHVTSTIMQRIADYFNIEAIIEPVGVDQLAAEIVKLEASGKIVVNGGEESGTYMVGDHIRDKDGFLAGVRLAEIAAAARSQGKTISDLLDEMYLVPEIGFTATTNIPIRHEVSIPGTAKKLAAVRWLQEIAKPAVEQRIEQKNYSKVAGFPLLDVDEQTAYRSGKYDDALGYPNYPDAGIRFYFNESKDSHITDRPSGTGPELRFYMQLSFSTQGLDLVALNQLKKDAYTSCLNATQEWIRIVENKDISVFTGKSSSSALGLVDSTANRLGGISLENISSETVAGSSFSDLDFKNLNGVDLNISGLKIKAINIKLSGSLDSFLK